MKPPCRVVGGFSLVEVVLALGVATISLVAICGLLPVGLQTSHNAIEESASADISSAISADLRSTPATSSNSVQYNISIPGATGGGGTTLYFDSEGRVSAAAATSRYRVTITFPANVGSRAATLVNIRVTWPGVAAPTTATGSAETFLALDRN